MALSGRDVVRFAYEATNVGSNLVYHESVTRPIERLGNRRRATASAVTLNRRSAQSVN
jgi:hypothetical protein